MEPWYKIATPRKEVREGRSFNPDEFAIALEQVVAGTAPKDYKDPIEFFKRTCFTRALREHAGMVLKRLSGKTDNTAPVLTLIPQFGGGKTHTLATLYHIAKSGHLLCQNPDEKLDYTRLDRETTLCNKTVAAGLAELLALAVEAIEYVEVPEFQQRAL